MTNTKTTKRSLFSSVVALLLCFTMLLGTTYAWFTDSVTSAGNIIKSGTLDVTMHWADGTKAVNDVSNPWKDASEGEIFSNEKWEPGYFAAKHIKIANVGSLAFKYKLLIVPEGNVDILADVIDVYFFNNADPVSRESLNEATPVGTLRKMIEDPDGAAYGYLLPKKTTPTDGTREVVGEQIVTIVLKMQETAGNEYQNKQIGKNFSIQLLATQYTYEKDDIDEKYDEDAQYSVVISSDTELKNALAADDESINVILTKDMAFDIKDNSSILMMGSNQTKSITINGNGHTITFNCASDNNNDITINSGAKLVINNATLTNSVPKNTKNEGIWNVHDIIFACDVELNNVTSEKALAFKANATLKNVTITDDATTDVYAIWIQPNGQTVTIDGCTIEPIGAKDGRGITINEQYVESNSKRVTLNVSNTTFITEEKAAIMVNSAAGADITLSSVDIQLVAADSENAVWVKKYGVGTVKVDGGTAIVEPADADQISVACANGADELKAAIEDGGKVVVLTTDIAYNNENPEKQMILESENAIEFNGNDKTITVTGANPSVGNHGYVGFVPTEGEKKATVSNLTVTGTGFVELGDYTVQGGTYTANNLNVKNLVSTLANVDKGFTLACGFAQYGTGTLNNCTMTGTTATIKEYNGHEVIPVDAGFVNYTTTVVNGGEYGVAYCWSHAKVTFDDDAQVGTLYVAPITGTVTIKAGTQVKELIVNYGTSASYATQANLQKLVIEEGATVEKIVYGETTYETVEAWNAYVDSLPNA